MEDGNEIDALLANAVRGDSSARDELVRRHAAELSRFVERQLGARMRRQVSIADVCQETFAVVLRSLDSLPEGATNDMFRARLFKNTEWVIAQFARRGRRFEGESQAPRHETPASAGTETGPVTRAEEIDRLRRLAERLPENYRAVVLLRLEGKSFAEIGLAVGLDEALARKRYERAYHRLRDAILDRLPDSRD